jgi:DNA-binding helix-hairpin-helix protein with protein kinase domain
MSALFPGKMPPRLRVDRDRIPVSLGSGLRTEVIMVMNEGGGTLRGTIVTDVPWITIPNLKIETPFILPIKIHITPEKIRAGAPVKGTVTMVTNGGSGQVTIEYFPHPEPRPVLTLDERQLQFCNLRKGDVLTADLIVKNTGSGVLSGTAESESDWIEVRNRTIWTRSMQVIPVVINTAAIPGVRQPVGKIRIRSSGGSQEVTVSVHFRTGTGPKLRIHPPRIRCVWENRGIIEETVTIHNDGEGILRGTIPSPVPWVKITPPIFPVQNSIRIRISIDTRGLPADGMLTIPVPVITNAGRDTLMVEVVAGRKTQAIVPPRRARPPSRIVYRNRLIAYDQNGRTYTLISSGRSGGEGEIYYLADTEERCAKIYHPHRRTPETEEKLRVMVSHPPSADLIGILTWPEVLLYDLPGGGRAIGYLMRRIPDATYKSAHLWYDEPMKDDLRGSFSRFIPALALARVVAGIHQEGHSVGDLRENNLLISDAGELMLIDTDSFQIRDPVNGKVFWSRVGTGEYLPPEHLDGSFTHEGCDRRFGDYFALAVLIFRFLMDGVHPFQAKGPLVRDAPATTDKILLGHFAFESRIAGISPPDYAPPYSTVPAPVKILFREAFVTGHTHPKSRPDADRWVRVLSALVPGDQVHERGNTAHLVLPPQDKKEKRTRILTDTQGNEIVRGRCLYRVSGGALYETTVEGIIVFLSDTSPLTPYLPVSLPACPVPPSVIIPTQPVFRGETTLAGWLIAGLDRDRFLPWHMLADPESRKGSGRASFTFRHRIACCRNLMAALISASRLNLPRPVISDRSVYVGPDASVRMLCIPPVGLDDPGKTDELHGYSPVILVFKMLMDGYHPFHATGSKIYGFRSPEKRMKAGMYPWSGSDPDLTRPGAAPPIEILPGEIRDLFEREFGENDGKAPGDQAGELSLWFGVLDRIFGNLVRCTSDPCHWYLPGYSGCPWCRQIRIQQVMPIRAGILLLPAPTGIMHRLVTPRIAGYLSIPLRYRRQKGAVISVQTRWGVILLPSERIYQFLLPPASPLLFLPLTENRPVLLVPVRELRVSCILPVLVKKTVTDTDLVIEKGENSHFTIYGEFLPYSSLDISLIDEMVLASTMDRLRGEGIGLPKNRKRNWPKQPSSRRRPVQVMLYPIDLPWPSEEMQSIVYPKKKHQVKTHCVKQRGVGKGIRGRLKTIIRDFIGEEY